MSNHSHEIFKVLNSILFSHQMRRHHSRYGIFFNKSENRKGKVAYDRPHTSLIGSYVYDMVATFYIHSNPLRAGMRNARNYPWSTHRLYAFGIRPPWMRNVQLPPWYEALGRSKSLRRKRYRQLFEKYLKDLEARKPGALKESFFGPSEWKLPLAQRVSAWKRQQRNLDSPPP